MMDNGSTDETKRRNHEIAGIAWPWASIVLTALVSTALVILLDDTTTSSLSEDLLEWDERNLQSQQHVHKPIYDEDHKPLFPLNSTDQYGFTLATLGLMIAAGGGIGGGGILVPIYILVMGFSPKHAIPLSNVTVFGGAVANTVLNIRKRHPSADRTLIDWDLILAMEPLTIAGALIGAFLNKVLPELLLTVLLVVLLTFTAYNSLKKAVKMYKKETQQMKHAGIREDGTKESELTKMTHETEEEDQEEAVDGLLENMEETLDSDEEVDKEEQQMARDAFTQDRLKEQELAKILEEERHTPRTNVMILLALFVVVLAINLLKGGGAFPSPIGIVCGSTSFWIANEVILGWIVLITIFCRQVLMRKHEAKVRWYVLIQFLSVLSR